MDAAVMEKIELGYKYDESETEDPALKLAKFQMAQTNSLCTVALELSDCRRGAGCSETDPREALAKAMKDALGIEIKWREELPGQTVAFLDERSISFSGINLKDMAEAWVNGLVL
ncbi:MAG: hypothetical protein A2365_02940 [Candidatus Nealsonbacteria bacterium RIFOXYB1_FULL_40_15]|uniref:Uncharacterized protein n=2 Tax=Candidatus Nealsoniibacteriota TaxID=1817911 RepID=A0A1G2ERM4_9BACT|nr:MAG: hypothetical protein A2365_02940 [Candidatus Nealsonbacteria bacterium RIFOXYB1_FULL_40_15]OGZ28454.1 MAG: hypothetical protein A2427_02565 [Candidatus Nealsonbacteria bacterium RIFOXYC1_FULL_40_7]OGZ29865.1 MAG: hypothetical protein A2562_01975 [Candidatus Nealsonbacteria bacterium RIFOXYD1_FULL_39_11]